MISQETNDLFKNAIAVSGASTGFLGWTSQPLKKAMLLADVFNCSAMNTQDIRTCLSKVGPNTLDLWGLVLDGSLRPVVDGEFVVRPPEESFELGAGQQIIHFSIKFTSPEYEMQ